MCFQSRNSQTISYFKIVFIQLMSSLITLVWLIMISCCGKYSTYPYGLRLAQISDKVWIILRLNSVETTNFRINTRLHIQPANLNSFSRLKFWCKKNLRKIINFGRNRRFYQKLSILRVVSPRFTLVTMRNRFSILDYI